MRKENMGWPLLNPSIEKGTPRGSPCGSEGAHFSPKFWNLIRPHNNTLIIADGQESGEEKTQS
jgi:hypothetical protein